MWNRKVDIFVWGEQFSLHFRFKPTKCFLRRLACIDGTYWFPLCTFTFLKMCWGMLLFVLEKDSCSNPTPLCRSSLHGLMVVWAMTFDNITVNSHHPHQAEEFNCIACTTPRRPSMPIRIYWQKQATHLHLSIFFTMYLTYNPRIFKVPIVLHSSKGTRKCLLKT